MIESLEFHFGATPTSEPLRITPSPMTIFVGPNNSGKSVVLQEIEHYIDSKANPGMRVNTKLLSFITPKPMKSEEVKRIIQLRNPDIVLDALKPPFTLSRPYLFQDGGIRKPNPVLNIETLLSDLHSDEYRGPYLIHIASTLTLRLDGYNRLTLTDAQPSSSLQGPPQNYLIALFKDRHARQKIRDIVADALGVYFTIDLTDLQQVRVRLAEHPPESFELEESLGPDGRAFHAAAQPIESFSDGVKAFTGLTAAVMSDDYRIVLIDEPEAFLHPPLARRLGKVLTQTIYDRGGNVFASTHSAEFLMGCIQAAHPLNIVRLTYAKGVATARALPNNTLSTLMTDPLLRSTGLLNALFHQGAVVCEADSDRAFYEEINERLLLHNEGARDTLFLHAQNKQTIQRLIKPLRQMGIPAAAVVDLDMLKDKDLTSLLHAAAVPQPLIDTWGNLKRRIVEAFDSQGVAMKEQGIAGLDRETQEVAQNLIDACAQYGIFLVPVGELECWLTELGVQAPKGQNRWLIAMFERLGSDPTASDYVHPGNDDVWAFLRRIATWIADPHRKGIPV